MGKIWRAGRENSLTGAHLKTIAMVTMLIDHIGVILIPPGLWQTLFRLIGRIAFPMYAFLLVEGFLHTGDVKKYKRNMLLFALLSEIPFNLFCSGSLFCLELQNVFLTFFLGLCLLERLERGGKELEEILTIALFAAVSWLLHCDYGALGIIIITVFYWHRKGRCPLPALVFMTALISMPLFSGVLAMVPISLYDGTRGRQAGKYVYYLFYPLHLLILYLLSLVI